MKRKIIFLTVILIAVFLRFYKLGLNPPSLYWDETINCYDSYSLLKTGRDHRGNLWPITYLTSYKDYKNPLYTYLTILPIKYFGLTEFACRFPSAFFGFLTVVVLYFLVKELFKAQNSTENRQKGTEFIALISSFLLAVSPWHLQFSRAGFEANINLFFIITGLYFFVKAINSRPFYLVISAISFGLTPYAYHSSKMFMPLLLVVITLINIKFIMRNLKWAIISLVIGLLMIYPLTTKDARQAVLYRFTETNIFNEEDVVLLSNKLREEDGWSLISNVFHNRRIFYLQKFLKHYFDHFNFSYLFLTGDDNIRHSTKAVGEFYFIEFPFLILGFYYFLKNKEKALLVPISWLFLSIIPASFTITTPHAIRTLAGLGSWQIITAYGFYHGFSNVNNKKLRKFLLSVICCLLFVNIIYYLHYYYSHYPKVANLDWQYGYKQIIGFIKENQDKYEKVIVSDHYGRAYGYLLFYLKYPPDKIQQEISSMAKSGKEFIGSFDKYIIASPNNNNYGSKVLRIGAPGDFSKGPKPIFTVYSLDNKPIFWAVAD